QILKPKDPEAVGKPGQDLSLQPACYHHRRGPMGIVMNTLEAKPGPPPFAVIGLEVGDMAAYAQPGQPVAFYETNPKGIGLSVHQKGAPYFTYIQDAKKRGAKVRIFQGQARELVAQKAPKNFYQVIEVEMCLRARLDDPCVELMTKEGMSLLLDKL